MAEIKLDIKKPKKAFLIYKLSVMFTLIPFISTLFFLIVFFMINYSLNLINSEVLEFGIETSEQKLFIFSLIVCLIIHLVFIINTYLRYRSFKIILKKDIIEIFDGYNDNIYIKNVVYAETKKNIIDRFLGFSSLYVYQKNQSLRIVRFLTSKNSLANKINKLVDSSRGIF